MDFELYALNGYLASYIHITSHLFLFPVLFNPFLGSSLNISLVMLLKHIETPLNRVVVSLVLVQCIEFRECLVRKFEFFEMSVLHSLKKVLKYEAGEGHERWKFDSIRDLVTLLGTTLVPLFTAHAIST